MATPIINSVCIGKSDCFYYKNNFGAISNTTVKVRSDLNLLVKKGWLKVLTGGEFKIYSGIWHLEQLKGIAQGALLIASHRELAKICGLTRQSIAINLPELHFHGLIKYKKGLQHRKHNIASEIRRVIPTPEIKADKIHSPPFCDGS